MRINRRNLLPALPVAVLLMLGGAPSCFASTFFFPDMKPRYVRVEPPEWLKEGSGGDGYVSITSEVIPVGSCARLSSTSFWGSEKEQLVLSLASNGFKNKLDKLEVPIATFDGRENLAECTSLSTSPLQIVPLTVLGSRTLLNPGKLSLTLTVKSSNDSQSDYVGSAKLLLGAVTLIGTGGASGLVTGASVAVGNSVLSDTEAKANKMMKGMTDSKVPVALNWGDLRSGLKVIEIPVYRADQSFGDVTDKKIHQLQADPKADKIQLFTVKLEFSYFRTLFYPNVEDLAYLRAHENMSADRILNYHAPGSNLNFMQILNNASPSLVRIVSNASGVELTRACAQGFEMLKHSGLNNPDIAIVMKSFIDESRGNSAWYADNGLVKACFSQAPKVEGFLEMIYGRAGSQ
ncbi:hypothetical protein [Fluviibacter phosphoraccumulans]|nr:hypothetical protein [Fluviibacter phosphoraccumulans]